MKQKHEEGHKGEKVFRYSIRKYHFGVASVAVAALMFFANGTVQAQAPEISPATESETTRTSALVIDSSGGVSKELNEETPVTPPSQPEQDSQGNQKPQEVSDENQALIKTSQEGKREKPAEASRPSVDKSLAQSTQSSLQALLGNLTLDSMKELHARVEAGLVGAKAVLENPNSSQEEVDAQVQVMKALTDEVNKVLAGSSFTFNNNQPVTLQSKTLRILLKEVDRLDKSKYTKDSLEKLAERVSKAQYALLNAKTQKEIDEAYASVISFKNSGLELEKKATVKPRELNRPIEKVTDELFSVRNSTSRVSVSSGESGFRSIPGYSYQVTKGSLDNLTAGQYLNRNVMVKLTTPSQNDRNQQVTTFPNIGPRLEYANLRTDGQKPYPSATEVNYVFVGNIPNEMVGAYNLLITRYSDKKVVVQIPIVVKPQKPTVTVDNIDTVAGKTATVKATALNSSDSKVTFYVNNIEKATVNAVNGLAIWTTTEKLNKGDKITAKNSAKADIHTTDAYGNSITVSRAESEISDAVLIPEKKSVDKTGLQTSKEALSNSIGDVPDTAGKTEASKKAYTDAKADAERALAKANEVLGNASATEAQVKDAKDKADEAKSALDQAKSGLQSVDKTGLQTSKEALSNSIGDVPDTAGKTEASKKAYTDAKADAERALAKANEVLGNASATEAQVKDAKDKADEAKSALDQAKSGLQSVDKTGTDVYLLYGVIVTSILALLGVLLFLIASRKKESELKKVTKELTEVLEAKNQSKVNNKLLKKAQEALVEAVAFLANEKDSEHREANEKDSEHREDDLIKKLKDILAELKQEL